MAWLLRLFRACWDAGVCPPAWKSGDLLPFRKPGRDPASPASYRPICLLSCVGKLLERLVHGRLSWWLESASLLPASLCGFRPGRGTLDVLAQLDHLIQAGFQRKGVTLVTFFDVASAFDSASHEAILWKLRRLGLQGSPLAWVEDFLRDRTCTVALGSVRSQEFAVRRGVPQGSVLSPLLFNVLLSDLPAAQDVHTLVYADDVSMVCTADSLPRCQVVLQAAVDSFVAWASRWGLSVNPRKSHLVCFTNCHAQVVLLRPCWLP